MHESGLVRSLVVRAAAIVEGAGTSPHRIGIRVGALSGVDPAVVRMYWERLAVTSLAGATLDIEVEATPDGPDSMGLVLTYVDVGEGG